MTWKEGKGTANAGDKFGSLSEANGYVQGCFAGKKMGVHRFAWLIYYGKLPDKSIDHINGDKTDNRIANLRELPVAHNNQNRRSAQSNSSTGVLGVSHSGKKFAATIKHDGRKLWIGTFDTPELAHDAYLAKKREIHLGNTL